MFGISGLQLLLILFVVAVVVGPSRLPTVAATITKWVKTSRVQLAKLRETLDEEVGEDLKDLDLSKLNVRQYDPRRMIREAVQEELDEWKQLVSPLGMDKPKPSPSRPPAPRSPAVSDDQTAAQKPAPARKPYGYSQRQYTHRIPSRGGRPYLAGSKAPTSRSSVRRLRQAKKKA
ncbi:MAG: twin-arginine translocase TatA/TatE family subunit [Actinomycetaceae bacterium]|nr:twin-arginine translocase TatA/TatE family subunit [Actinomycetaceae bacterium]